MNQDKLNAQFEYLNKLRGLHVVKLRLLHDNTFTGTKWAVHIPKWMHRKAMEQRLWYFWSAQNYHLKKDDPRFLAFRTKACRVLDQKYVDSFATKERIAEQQLLEHERFTWEAIANMPLERVDRYLAALDVHVDALEKERRRCLWEYFHLPASKLPIKRKRYRNTAATKSLAGLIRLHPDMDFEAFRDRFGDLLPTVTRRGFADSRYAQRLKGFVLPKMKPGRKKIAG